MSRNRSSRRSFLRTAGMISLGAAMASCASRTARIAAGKRPNVLLLFSDDQRFSTIHALGCRQIATPNLDALVRRGTSFTHACIMGGNQGAVCVPSRAMLLTGRTLFRCEQKGAIQSEHITLPQHLKDNGYVTFIAGKWHNDKPSLARSFSCGGPIFFGGMADHLATPVQDFDPTGRYPAERARTADRFSSELFADAAVNFLRSHRGDTPFFAYVPFTAPHDPRMAPKAYREMYDPQTLPLPENFLPEHPFDIGERNVRDELLAPYPRTPDVVRRHLADYYAMITHMDAQIGRVLAALDQSGQADNTIVVFAGDNGLAVGQHGLFGKQNLYDHSIRVPLILAGPGIRRNARSDALCYLLDLYPTLCQCLELDTPNTVEGLSFAANLQDPGREHRPNVFLAYRNLHRAVRTRQHKLIEYYIGKERHTHLFDVQRDPWEKTNLAEQAQQAGTLARLRSELAQWQATLGDPMIRA